MVRTTCTGCTTIFHSKGNEEEEYRSPRPPGQGIASMPVQLVHVVYLLGL
jgi:hypothetical protein